MAFKKHAERASGLHVIRDPGPYCPYGDDPTGGRGPAVGFELVAERQSRAPAAEAAAKLVTRAFELGLVLYYVGASSNVLEMTPPLTLSADEATPAVSILDRALLSVTSATSLLVSWRHRHVGTPPVSQGENRLATAVELAVMNSAFPLRYADRRP